MSTYLKWWIFGPLIGLLTLANIRCQLLENNLFDTYVAGEWPSAVCEPDSLNYRSADGSCNDLDLPAMGMAGVRMGRNIQPDYSWQDADKLLTLFYRPMLCHKYAEVLHYRNYHANKHQQFSLV